MEKAVYFPVLLVHYGIIISGPRRGLGRCNLMNQYWVEPDNALEFSELSQPSTDVPMPPYMGHVCSRVADPWTWKRVGYGCGLNIQLQNYRESNIFPFSIVKIPTKSHLSCNIYLSKLYIISQLYSMAIILIWSRIRGVFSRVISGAGCSWRSDSFFYKKFRSGSGQLTPDPQPSILYINSSSRGGYTGYPRFRQRSRETPGISGGLQGIDPLEFESNRLESEHPLKEFMVFWGFFIYIYRNLLTDFYYVEYRRTPAFLDFFPTIFVHV